MNKNVLYLLLIGLFLGSTAFIIIRYQNHATEKRTYYELLNRKGPLASGPEWDKTKSTSRRLFQFIAENPSNTKPSLELAALFIREARITGNYAYYDLAAMWQIDKVLAKEPDNFVALTYKALVYLSQHHFSDALEIARKAKELNPNNNLVYGMLVDANVELGHYDSAVQYADKMVSMRPDLSSYSRISYLREIFGDYPGAIEAMKMAVEAGLPGEDNTEWTRVQLGHLYENVGKPDSAEILYSQSLYYRKGYAPALSGLGHLAYVNEDLTNALKLYEEADSLTMDHATEEYLVKLYRLTGQKQRSNELAENLISRMSADAVSADDNNLGHYVDRELAYAYLLLNDTENALKHALMEYNRRPDNIDVNLTVGWVYYKMSDYNSARKYIETALKTNSKNPVLLAQAGLILLKSGDPEKGLEIIRPILDNNAGIDPELRAECFQAMNNDAIEK